MLLEIAHPRLDIFQFSKNLALSCYLETKAFLSAEKFGIIQKIRRAALSVHLNIAERCLRKSMVERKGFYEIAGGSLIEIDSALDIGAELSYATTEKLGKQGKLMVRSLQIISKLTSK